MGLKCKCGARFTTQYSARAHRCVFRRKDDTSVPLTGMGSDGSSFSSDYSPAYSPPSSSDSGFSGGGGDSGGGGASGSWD